MMLSYSQPIAPAAAECHARKARRYPVEPADLERLGLDAVPEGDCLLYVHAIVIKHNSRPGTFHDRQSSWPT